MLAHVAGAPVEEMALSLAPMAFAAVILMSLHLRRLAARHRPIRLRRDGRGRRL